MPYTHLGDQLPRSLAPGETLARALILGTEEDVRTELKYMCCGDTQDARDWAQQLLAIINTHCQDHCQYVCPQEEKTTDSDRAHR